MVGKMAGRQQELVKNLEEADNTIRQLEDRLSSKDGEVEEVLQRKADDAAIAQKGRKDAERALEERTGQLCRMEERMVQREEEVTGLQGAVEKNQKLLEKERQKSSKLESALRGELKEVNSALHRARNRLKERDETIRRMRNEEAARAATLYRAVKTYVGDTEVGPVKKDRGSARRESNGNVTSSGVESNGNGPLSNGHDPLSNGESAPSPAMPGSNGSSEERTESESQDSDGVN